MGRVSDFVALPGGNNNATKASDKVISPVSS
jgi:hypothetical protein